MGNVTERGKALGKALEERICEGRNSRKQHTCTVKYTKEKREKTKKVGIAVVVRERESKIMKW